MVGSLRGRKKKFQKRKNLNNQDHILVIENLKAMLYATAFRQSIIQNAFSHLDEAKLENLTEAEIFLILDKQVKSSSRTIFMIGLQIYSALQNISIAKSVSNSGIECTKRLMEPRAL